MRPGAEAEWSSLPGSPTALADAADHAARAGAHLDGSRARLLRVHAMLEDQQSGAVGRARHRITALADDARAAGTMLEAAAATLRRHAATLADAQATAHAALTDRAEALAREARWRAEADEARRSTWNIAAVVLPAAGVLPTATGPTSTLGDGPEQAALRLAAAERELARARADVAAAEARWRAARDAKAESSRRAAAALTALADVRAVRAVAAAGADPAGLQASGEAARRTLGLLPRAASGDDAARDDVRRILLAHADDGAFWAVFWDTASPARLYDALAPGGTGPTGPPPGGFGGRLDDGGALEQDDELARALGHGVRLWARTASTDDQRELGRRIVEDVAETAGSPLARPGVSAVAAALLPESLPAAVHAGADDALDAWWADRPPLDGSYAVLAPVAVAVAAGLAAHPRLAFDRLAPADQGRLTRSTSRWFATLPRTGWPDGGRAVAGAFGAAVDVGSTSADRTDQARAASLVSHATSVLPAGLLRTPRLADEAARSVAIVYEPYLSSVGDAVREQTPSTSPSRVEPFVGPAVDQDAEATPGSGDDAPMAVQPELDAFALRRVIGATSRTPGATSAWLGVTDRHMASVLEQATSEHYDVDTGPRKTLVQDALGDVGAVAGGMQAETIDAARAEMESRQTVVDLVGAGAGYLRFSNKALTEAVSHSRGPLLSLVDVDAPLDDARVQVRATEDELIDRYAADVYHTLVEHDRDLGLDPAKVRTRTKDHDPSRNGSTPRTLFDAPFDQLSDPHEEN